MNGIPALKDYRGTTGYRRGPLPVRRGFAQRLPPARDMTTIAGIRTNRGGIMDMGRRAFLRGRARRLARPSRPPWAGDEVGFLRTCDRCGDCIAACSTALLARGGGGFPEADFSRGHCTFCADCARACADAARKSARTPVRPALLFSPGSPWSLRAVIDSACLPRQGALCRSCEERCEAGALRFSPRPGGPALPVVGPSCTGCGRCVAACPVQAISMHERPNPAPAP
jgi:ferredoxin-type protein NapF